MDVFLSYAAEDRERARSIARALEACGWSVWWDRKIVAGETFDLTIERQLESAKCVVVLWSIASVASEWVKNEAASAAERQVLVPALVDDVRIPLEFRRRQTANLLGWNGGVVHEGFQALREGVAARVGSTGVALEPRKPTSHTRRILARQQWSLVAGGIVLIVLAGWATRAWVMAPHGATASIAASHPSGVPANTVDNPLPIAFGGLRMVTLEQNETYYFRLPSPTSAFTIVQDVRLRKKARSNLQTQLSILDTEGGVVQANIISFNEIDVGFRKTGSFSVKHPAQFRFKLVNVAKPSDVWLGVMPEGQKQFLPFFDEIVPQPWPAGKDAAGTLERDEDAYYLVRMPRGDSGVILDFTNAKQEHTNLQGYLAVLAADGGGQQEIIQLNEIDVSYRKAGTISIKTDERVILRLQNSGPTVTYNLRIANAQ